MKNPIMKINYKAIKKNKRNGQNKKIINTGN